MAAQNAIHYTTRASWNSCEIIQNRWLQKALYTIWWRTLCTVQEFVIFSFQFPFFYKISPWKNSIILLLCKNVHLKWSHEEFSHDHWLLKFISFWRGVEIYSCWIMKYGGLTKESVKHFMPAYLNGNTTPTPEWNKL